jgi:hypothetical protein
MFRKKTSGADVAADELSIQPNWDTAGSDPLTKRLIFPFIAIRLKIPPRRKFFMRSELGKPALHLKENFPMD